MARVELIKYSVIKYGRGDYVSYPLERYKEKIQLMHGKEVYAMVISEELYQPL